MGSMFFVRGCSSQRGSALIVFVHLASRMEEEMNGCVKGVGSVDLAYELSSNISFKSRKYKDSMQNLS